MGLIWFVNETGDGAIRSNCNARTAKKLTKQLATHGYRVATREEAAKARRKGERQDRGRE